MMLFLLTYLYTLGAGHLLKNGFILCLGNELNYMDFQRIRIEMEWKARAKKSIKKKNIMK